MNRKEFTESQNSASVKVSRGPKKEVISGEVLALIAGGHRAVAAVAAPGCLLTRVICRGIMKHEMST